MSEIYWIWIERSEDVMRRYRKPFNSRQAARQYVRRNLSAETTVVLRGSRKLPATSPAKPDKPAAGLFGPA